MQGSASLREDVRQPPYLCPVDLAKVLEATGVKRVRSNRRKMKGRADGDDEDNVMSKEEQQDQRAQRERQRQRYEALLEVCNRHRETGMFAAFGAWIRERLREEGKLMRR
jgi:archaemetzincin